MVRMGERLELADALGCPLPKRITVLPSLSTNACEKLCLRGEGLGPQTDGLTNGTNGAEIHMRGDVLLPWTCQSVARQLMVVVTAQCALLPLGHEEFLCR